MLIQHRAQLNDNLAELGVRRDEGKVLDGPQVLGRNRTDNRGCPLLRWLDALDDAQGAGHFLVGGQFLRSDLPIGFSDDHRRNGVGVPKALLQFPRFRGFRARRQEGRLVVAGDLVELAEGRPSKAGTEEPDQNDDGGEHDAEPSAFHDVSLSKVISMKNYIYDGDNLKRE